MCSGCLRDGGRALVRISSIFDSSEQLLIVEREVLESVGGRRAGVGVFEE